MNPTNIMAYWPPARVVKKTLRLGPSTTAIIAILCLLTLSARADDSTFSTAIKPFLNSYCVDCHGEGNAEGDVRLDNLEGKFSDRREAGVWGEVLEALAFRYMPLATADAFPTTGESRTVQKWIADNLNRHDIEFENKSTAEGFGNLVPHDLLFSSKERHRKVDVTARIWRVSPETLRSELSAASRFNLPVNPFAFDKPHGNFRDFKGKYLLNSIMTEQLTELAMIAAENQTKDNAHERQIESMTQRGATREGALQELLKRQFQNVLRRQPTAAELSRTTALMQRVDKELGAPLGLQTAFAAIILNPETIFRYEGTQPTGKDSGLVQLSGKELAHALAYALTDRPPDRQLLMAFSTEDVPVQQLLYEQASKLLAESQYAQPRLLQFFQEYFDYEKANDIFKDVEKGHHHWAPSLVNDLDTLITHTLEEDEQVLKTLLTTSEFFIHINSYHDYHSPLAYNLPHDFKQTRKPVQLPTDQRRGILTHPAWLIAHSGNFDNDPIRRGLWIRKKLLGGNVPDVPITVDAKLPDEPTWTLRKRMHVTQADQCYKCHSKMNPLGLPFERFDHFGRYRLDELDAPVQTSGAILRSGTPELDGSVKGPFELIDRLAKSKHVEQVFVRHVFRFFMGRNETLGDAKTLQDAHAAYVSNNGSMQALVVSLLSSDSFIYRAGQR